MTTRYYLLLLTSAIKLSVSCCIACYLNQIMYFHFHNENLSRILRRITFSQAKRLPFHNSTIRLFLHLTLRRLALGTGILPFLRNLLLKRVNFPIRSTLLLIEGFILVIQRFFDPWRFCILALALDGTSDNCVGTIVLSLAGRARMVVVGWLLSVATTIINGPSFANLLLFLLLVLTCAPGRPTERQRMNSQ